MTEKASSSIWGLKEMLIFKKRIRWFINKEGEEAPYPMWYVAFESFHESKQKKEEKIKSLKEETEKRKKWFDELGEMLGNKFAPTWRLSGALSIEALRDLSDPEHIDSRKHTNTDIIILGQEPIIVELLNRARKKDFYPMRRISGKDLMNPKVKYHFYHPVELNEIVSGKRIRNLELARIIHGPEIIGKICPRNHIKVYVHYQNGNNLVCYEDKHQILYDPEFLENRFQYKTASGHSFYIVDPRYSFLKLMVAKKEKESCHPKHEQDLETLRKMIEKREIERLESKLK